MNKAVIHEIGNYLHQIISNAEYSTSCIEVKEYSEKIKDAAYKIDALITDSTSNKKHINIKKYTSSDIDFKQFKGLKVLIVDDIEENIYIMEKIFNTLACDIVSANSGEEALKIFKDGFSPNIVCMDMMMPGIDGATATKELRLLGCKAYFIAISALKNQSHDIVSIFDSWLQKPFTIEQVNGALMGYSIANIKKTKNNIFIISDSIDDNTKTKILEFAKLGAYSELKRIILKLKESESKSFLEDALNKVDFNAIIKSIVSS